MKTKARNIYIFTEITIIKYHRQSSLQAYQCDVSDAELVVKTFEKIDNELGPITGVVAVSHHEPRFPIFQI